MEFYHQTLSISNYMHDSLCKCHALLSLSRSVIISWPDCLLLHHEFQNIAKIDSSISKYVSCITLRDILDIGLTKRSNDNFLSNGSIGGEL